MIDDFETSIYVETMFTAFCDTKTRSCTPPCQWIGNVNVNFIFFRTTKPSSLWLRYIERGQGDPACNDSDSMQNACEHTGIEQLSIIIPLLLSSLVDVNLSRDRFITSHRITSISFDSYSQLIVYQSTHVSLPPNGTVPSTGKN
jgi:hypothetical protein